MKIIGFFVGIGLAVMTVFGWHAPTKPRLISEIIEEKRVKYNLPKGVIEAVIEHESNFDAEAVNNEKSLCGKPGFTKDGCKAVGAMQTVFHWYGWGLKSPEELKDLDTNIDRGAKKLSEHLISQGIRGYNPGDSNYGRKIEARAKWWAAGDRNAKSRWNIAAKSRGTERG